MPILLACTVQYILYVFLAPLAYIDKLFPSLSTPGWDNTSVRKSHKLSEKSFLTFSYMILESAPYFFDPCYLRKIRRSRLPTSVSRPTQLQEYVPWTNALKNPSLYKRFYMNPNLGLRSLLKKSVPRPTLLKIHSWWTRRIRSFGHLF